MAGSLPTDYDVIVVGSGMIESILASAVARVGKSVLHLDSNEHYSGSWATHSWNAFQKFVTNQSETSLNKNNQSESIISFDENNLLNENERLVKSIKRKDIINIDEQWTIENKENDRTTGIICEDEKDNAMSSSNIEMTKSDEVDKDKRFETETVKSEQSKEPSDEKVERGEEMSDREAIKEEKTEYIKQEMAEQNEKTKEPIWTREKFVQMSRKFNLDLIPKLLYSRGTLVELLISSNIARYTEFKSVTQLLTFHQGHLKQVPSCRSDVFNSRDVTLIEKRQLMKLINDCLEQKREILYENFENSTFDAFLRSRKLSENIVHYVTHAIAMVQPNTPTPDAMNSLFKFIESIGRYGNTPFLWPMYGSGELPQCFCRMCAVFGGIYHLSRGLEATILDSQNNVKGIVSSGQRFNCRYLFLEATSAPDIYTKLQARNNISRAIIITNKSIYNEGQNEKCEALYLMRLPMNERSITVIQLGPSASACPEGLFVVHFTRESGDQAAECDLKSAVSQLFTDNDILYSVYFNIIGFTIEKDKLPINMGICYGPDGDLDFDKAVNEARGIFQRHFPNEEFLPKAPDANEIIFCDDEDKQSSVITGGASPQEEGRENQKETMQESVEVDENQKETKQESVEVDENQKETKQESVEGHEKRKEIMADSVGRAEIKTEVYDVNKEEITEKGSGDQVKKEDG